MEINSYLEQFGLHHKESDVYLALLELGTSGVNEIAVKANIKRTTVYDVLSNLNKKGLVGQTSRGKKRLFFSEEPEKLNKLLEEKQNKLAEILPILKSLHNTAGSKPKIRYYEGIAGLKDVYRDTLEHQGEILAFVTEDILFHLGQDFADEYIEKRKTKKIKARVIGPDHGDIIIYKNEDKDELRETRLVPEKKFPFSIEMNIYGNHLAFMSFKEEMGVIVESTEIAKNMKLLFELAWEGAKFAK